MKHTDQPKYAVGDRVYVYDHEADIEYGFYSIKMVHGLYAESLPGTKFEGYIVENIYDHTMSIDEDWIDDTRTKNQA
jgi:hypothetical protein